MSSTSITISLGNPLVQNLLKKTRINGQNRTDVVEKTNKKTHGFEENRSKATYHA